MAPKKKAGPKKPRPPPAAKKPAGNTVRALLSTVGVDDPDVALAGCESLEAQFAVIKKSWHRAVLKNHPDKGGDRAVFEAIQAAFEVLRDMKVNGELDSFVVAAGDKKSTASAFKVKQTKKANQKPASWEFYAEAAEVTMPLYKVELAKSGRSKCGMAARCKFGEDNPSVLKPHVISKDTVRVGSIDLQSGAYGRWVHLECWRVPGKIHGGLPHPSGEANPAVFEEALLSMNEVLLCGLSDLSAEQRALVTRHCMDVNTWATLGVKAVKGTGKAAGKSAAAAAAGTRDGDDQAAAAASGTSGSGGGAALVLKSVLKGQKRKAENEAAAAMARQAAGAAAAARASGGGGASLAAAVAAASLDASSGAVVVKASKKAKTASASKGVAGGGGGGGPSAVTALVPAMGKGSLFVAPRPGQGLAVAGCLSGKTVVLTGIFPELGGGAGLDLGKAKARALVESFGGRVTSAVSGKTDVLLVGKEPGMSKVTQARSKPGCILMNLSQLSGELTAGRALPGGGSADAGALTSEVNIASFSAGYAHGGGANRFGNGLAAKASTEALAYAVGIDLQGLIGPGGGAQKPKQVPKLAAPPKPKVEKAPATLAALIPEQIDLTDCC